MKVLNQRALGYKKPLSAVNRGLRLFTLLVMGLPVVFITVTKCSAAFPSLDYHAFSCVTEIVYLDILFHSLPLVRRRGRSKLTICF